MANDRSIPPPVLWAQRNDKIYLTFNVADCKAPSIVFDENKCTFKGHGGAEDKHYEVTIEFHKEIDPQKSHYAVLPRHIPMVVIKKDGGPYWPRLLKEKKKVHWLSTDFNKWRDEDDSDNEDGEDVKFEEMMKQMGNFSPPSGGPGAGPGGDMMAGDMMTGEMPCQEPEEDSDDDDLPDLE